MLSGRSNKARRTNSETNVKQVRFETLEERRLLALVPELVADIAPGHHFGQIRELATLDDQLVFTAGGGEIFRVESDVAFQVRPPSGLEAHQLTAVGDSLFFTQSDAQLWWSDGIAESAQIAQFTGSILAETNGFPPRSGGIVALPDAALFVVGTPASQQLWSVRTDDLSVSLVREFNQVAVHPNWGVAIDGVWYFAADDGTSGAELWRSDGTAAGTWMVADIAAGVTNSSPNSFATLGGQLYFAAADGGHGRELWTSDGTLDGTKLVADVALGTASSYPAELTRGDGTLLFVADDGVVGQELWRFEPGDSAAALVADLTPGAGGTNLRELISVGDQTYFLVRWGKGDELFRSDGTAEGTVAVVVADNISIANASQLTPWQGELYFSAAASGLWRVDSDTQIAEQAIDLFADANVDANGHVQRLTTTHERLYFTAWSLDLFSQGKLALWSSDGTSIGTQPIYSPTLEGPLAESQPLSLTPLRDKLLTNACTALLGCELWSTTTDSAALVTDIAPGVESGLPYNASEDRLTRAGDFAYFVPYRTTAGQELWRTDGTAAGTFQLADISPGPAGSTPTSLTLVGDTLYFTAYDPEHGRELWKSDGTREGTQLVADLWNGPDSSSPSSLSNVGGSLYFAARDDVLGTNVWVSDGTAGGTRVVADAPIDLLDFSITNLWSDDEQIYFVTQTLESLSIFQLWKVNEDVGGAIELATLPTVVASQHADPNGGSFFSSGSELWHMDGTPQGTFPLHTFTSGVGGSYLSIGDQTYFAAGTVENGGELWASDGTVSGTRQIADLNPGVTSSNPYGLTVLDGRLFFTAYDGVGMFLWELSDPAAGPTRVAPAGHILTSMMGTLLFSGENQQFWKYDPETREATPLGSGSPSPAGPYSPTRLGATLYFAASDEQHGRELWKFAPPPGDTNFDGQVDIVDLNNVRNNFGATGDVLGDANGDGSVDIVDLNAVRNNFGAGVPSSAPVVRESRPGDAARPGVAGLIEREAAGTSSSANWQDALFRAQAEAWFASDASQPGGQARRLKAVDRWFSIL